MIPQDKERLNKMLNFAKDALEIHDYGTIDFKIVLEMIEEAVPLLINELKIII